MSIQNYFLIAAVFGFSPWGSGIQPVVFLYLGPETVMPLASILAAIVGALLIGWRYLASYLRKAVKGIRNGSNGAASDDAATAGSMVEDGDDSSG